MAPFTHAVAPALQTDSHPAPGLLPARRLARERDPERPPGSYRSVSHLTAFTEGEINKTQQDSLLQP